IAFIGDGNNVATSLALGAAIVGAHFTIASPKGYELEEEVWHRVEEYASLNGCHVASTTDASAAARGADVIYTDVWTSMGQEAEAEQRRRDFAQYQVNTELLSLSKKDALFMHPLPAHHGEEIQEGILDHSQSVVFDQAENRLHIQKALLLHLMG
ncbi:MAG: ornithine carbamoyltransferase, partial [Dehalococcoidia bacterium]